MQKGSILLLSISVVFTNNIYAINKVGDTLLASGEAYTHSLSGQMKAIVTDSEIFMGDTISTKDNTRLQIRLTDTSMLSVQSNTKFTFEQYLYKPSTHRGFNHILLHFGGLKIQTGEIATNNSHAFIIKTDKALASTNGAYWGVYKPKISKDVDLGENLFVSVWESNNKLNVRSSVLIQSGYRFLEIGPMHEFSHASVINSQSAIKGLLAQPENFNPILPVESSPKVAKTTDLSIEPKVVESKMFKSQVISGEISRNTNSSGKYTLQLLGARNEDNVKKFITDNNLSEGATYDEIVLNGKPWFVLTYGRFETRNEAVEAINLLPKSVRQLKPFPKLVKSTKMSTD